MSKKSKKTNDITFFNNKYQNFIDSWELNENELFDIDESLSYNEENLLHKDTANYQWVYNLRLNNYTNEKFSKLWTQKAQSANLKCKQIAVFF